MAEASARAVGRRGFEGAGVAENPEPRSCLDHRGQQWIGAEALIDRSEIAVEVEPAPNEPVRACLFGRIEVGAGHQHAAIIDFDADRVRAVGTFDQPVVPTGRLVDHLESRYGMRGEHPEDDGGLQAAGGTDLPADHGATTRRRSAVAHR